MAQYVARDFPIEVPNPDAVPPGERHLRTLARTRPRDLTHRELLGGVYTVVHRLYTPQIEDLTLTDSTTIDVAFEDGRHLRVELLSDDATITEADVAAFRELYPKRRVLVVFAGPIDDHARALFEDSARLDFLSLTLDCIEASTQLTEWINNHERS